MIESETQLVFESLTTNNISGKLVASTELWSQEPVWPFWPEGYVKMIVTEKGSYAMLFLVGGGLFCMGKVKMFFIDTNSCLWCCGEVAMETSSGVNSHLIGEIRSYQWVLIKSDHMLKGSTWNHGRCDRLKAMIWVLSKGWTGRMFPENRFVYSHGQHGWKVLMYKRDSNLYIFHWWSIFQPW